MTRVRVQVTALFVALSCLSPAAFSQAPAPAAPAADQVITRSTFRNVSKQVSPAVVNLKIKSDFDLSAAFGGPGRGGAAGRFPDRLGGLQEELREMLEQQFDNMPLQEAEESLYSRSASGVIIRPDGYIVTSYHVIQDTDAADIEIALHDGRSFDKVQIVGTDDLTDLAVIKIDATGLPTIPWGDSEKVEVGDFVVAVGNPLEFNNSVSMGNISAKHRVIKKAPIEDLLQTTAMINPGNSGGALVDLDSQLIGINMAIATNSGMWSGLGFAIPSKTAKDVTDQIIGRGRVSRGYLGIEMSPLTTNLARQLDYEHKFGIVVKNVRPGSAAEKAGLQRYDIIAKVNDKEIKDIYDMHRSVGARAANEAIELEVYRDENQAKLAEKKITAQLEERPPDEELKQTQQAPRLPSQTGPSGDDLLGLRVKPAPGGKGLTVEEVLPNSRAALNGIQKGDLILQANKTDVNAESELRDAIKSSTSNSHLLYVEREGQSNFFTIQAK